MRSDQFNGDDPQNIRPEWRGGQPGEGPYLLRVAASEDIEPGGSGLCRVVDWNGTELASSTREITVYDPMKILCACKALEDEHGDRFWVLWNVDSRRWEPAGEFGLSRPGKLSGDLGYGLTATAVIWKYNGAAMAATAVSVAVYDWLLQTGADDILSGIQVELRYDRDRDSWRVIGAQCAA